MAVRELEYANRWILYGSGDIARFEDYTVEYEANGEEVYVFHIYAVDNKRLRERYNLRIKDEIDPDTGLMVKKYPGVWVMPLPSGAKRMLIWVKCDPLGKETPATKETQDKDNTIRQLQRQLRSANAQNYVLTAKVNRMVENLPEQLKRDKLLIDTLTGKARVPSVGEQDRSNKEGEYDEQ